MTATIISADQSSDDARHLSNQALIEANLARFDQLDHDEIIEHNLAVVAEHFHNENPDNVDKAIALYGPEISWEGPSRGQVITDPALVKEAYLGIYRTLQFHDTTYLRRWATEDFVFDDQIAHLSVVGDEMANLPFPKGTELSLRLVHCFEMKDGLIASEIAYELWREAGSPVDSDVVPVGSVTEQFS